MTLRLALLAAGCASRYGGNKLLAVHPASQQPLLHHVISEYIKALNLTSVGFFVIFKYESRRNN